jgi:undecaprenyl-diphosphatase
LTLLEALVLGLVQGLTEFLPVSSSGHLRIVPAFFGWDDPGTAFTAVTQLGTIAAVLLYFRHDLTRIARAFLTGLRSKAARTGLDYYLGWYLILGTVPISVIGLTFRDFIETSARSLVLISIMLIALGLLLLLAERTGKRERGVEDVRLRDALLIGLAQSAALIPGVSRSGATITMGLFLGLQREAAARFSFLLSVPAIVLSGLLLLPDVAGEDTGTSALAITLATLVAFASGYASIAFLLRFLVTHTTFVFIAYRVVLGTAVLVLFYAGVIS